MRIPLRRLVSMVAVASVAVGLAPAHAQEDPAAASEAPVIEVLDPGSGQLEPLRYVFTPGTETTTVLRLSTTVSQRVNGRDPVRGSTPEIEVDLRATIGEPTQSAATVALVFEDVRVGAGASQLELEDALEPLVGFEATLTSTNRGEVLEAEANLPVGLDTTSEQLLTQFIDQAQSLTVPLPEEPLGKGARWTATTNVTVSGITIKQVATYQLAKITQTGAELKYTVKQTAPRQTYEDPASGISVELLSSRGKGTGSFTLDLTAPLPSKAKTHVSVKQRLSAEGDEVAQTVVADAELATG